MSISATDLQQVNGVWLPASDTHFKEAIEKTGSYLPERLEAAITYCDRKKVAVDIGAHVGLYTRLLMEAFDEVYAFEPADDSYACLERNVAAVSGSVHLHHVAVGREAGVGELHADPLPKRQGNSGARFVRQGYAGPVSLVTLDQFNLSACDFLKIDVEGMELDVLKGAYGTIVRCQPVVMIEVGKVPEERYNTPTLAPIDYLQRLGMQVVLEMKADKVLIWSS